MRVWDNVTMSANKQSRSRQVRSVTSNRRSKVVVRWRYLLQLYFAVWLWRYVDEWEGDEGGMLVSRCGIQCYSIQREKEKEKKDRSRNQGMEDKTQLIAHPLAAVGKLCENAPSLHELLVRALLRNDAIVYYQNSVAHAHHRELVRHDQRGAPKLRVP